MIFKLKKPDMVQEAAQTGGKNVILEILMFIGILIVAMLLENIVYSITYSIVYITGLLTWDALLVLQLFLTIIMILTTLLFCKLVQKRKMRTLGYKKPGMWKEYGVGLLLGLGMMTAVVAVGALTGSLELQFNSEAMTASGIGFLVLLFLGFVFQGMSEEVMCRGYFLVSLARKNGSAWFGIIISSLAFAALHLGNSGIAPLAFANLILFGIFEGVYFVKRGNIWGVAAIHSIWNFAQGNIYGILVSGNDYGMTLFKSDINESMTFVNGGDFGLEGGILVTIVLVVGILITLMTKQKDVAEEAMSQA